MCQQELFLSRQSTSHVLQVYIVTTSCPQCLYLKQGTDVNVLNLTQHWCFSFSKT
jgi:hypothetical protein